MIELPVQPTLPVLPGTPELAQIGELAGIDFAAQLAVLSSKPPVMDVLADGKVPPSPGKTLPVELDLPDSAPLSAAAPSLPVTDGPVEAKPVPIMRPFALRTKMAAEPLPDIVALESTPEDSAEQPALKAEEHNPTQTEQALPILLVALQVLRTTEPSPLITADQIARSAGNRTAIGPHEFAQRQMAASIASSAPTIAETMPPTDVPAGRVVETERPTTSELSPVSLAAAKTTDPIGELLPVGAEVRPRIATAPGLISELAPLAASAAPPRKTDPRRPAALLAPATIASIQSEVRFAAIEQPTLAPAKTLMPQPLLADPTANLPSAPIVPASAPDRTSAPQDFVALIDRLIASREASGASVAVAVRHAEFGSVTLRFEQADSGLTVAATSPDPDFARAAVAAMPAERPAGTENAPRDGGKPFSQDSASAQTGSHSGQSRQSSAMLSNTPARNRPHLPATSDEARDSGIFA